MAKKPIPEKDTRKLGKVEVQWLPANWLKPNEYNPNRQSDHDFELLCRSMRSDGFTTPILALQPEGEISETNQAVIVDGFHRWKAGQAIGYEKIPVVLTSMSEAQRRIATLRHNRARGHEDPMRVAAMLKDLADEGNILFAQEELMLDDVEIEHLLQNVEIEEVEQLRVEAEAEVTEQAEAEGRELTEEELAQQASDLMRKKRDDHEYEKRKRDLGLYAKEKSNVYAVNLVYADEVENAVLTRALGKDRRLRQEQFLAICRMLVDGQLPELEEAPAAAQEG